MFSRFLGNEERLHQLFSLLGVGLALAISMANWHLMNPDGIAYLEVGEHWLRGDAQNALNGYWNPLYPIVMAALAGLAPSRLWEPALMHFGMVLIFVASLAAFRFFLHEFKGLLQAYGARNEQLSPYVTLFGYPIFIWASLDLIRLEILAPDLLVNVWMFLAGAMICRILRGAPTVKTALGLGVALALGYLTKTVVFLLAWLIFGLLLLESLKAKRWKVVLLAMGSFLLVAAPHILGLSWVKGRFTYGDSGPLAYAWEVNRFSPYIHWQGQPEGSGVPKKTTTQILEYPPVYIFQDGRQCTYPPGFDPSGWQEGLKPRFDLMDQLKAFPRTGRVLADFAGQPITIGLVLAFLFAGTAVSWRSFARELWRFRIFWVVCLATIALYSAVYIETRYLSPFLLWTAFSFFGAAVLAGSLEKPGVTKFIQVLSVFIIAVVFIQATWSTVRGLVKRDGKSYLVHQSIAQQLAQLGLEKGDQIAIVGRGCDAFFARLGEWKISGEAPVMNMVGHPEWAITPSNLSKISQAFAHYPEIRAVITQSAPVDQVEGLPVKSLSEGSWAVLNPAQEPRSEKNVLVPN